MDAKIIPDPATLHCAKRQSQRIMERISMRINLEILSSFDSDIEKEKQIVTKSQMVTVTEPAPAKTQNV